MYKPVDYVPVWEDGRQAIRDARAIAAGRNALYLGTRNAPLYLQRNTLRTRSHVWFTRCPHVAAFTVGTVSVRGDHPAILVFDRWKLRSRYRVVPFHDWDDWGELDPRSERILTRELSDLRRYLIGIAWVDIPTLAAYRARKTARKPTGGVLRPIRATAMTFCN